MKSLKKLTAVLLVVAMTFAIGMVSASAASVATNIGTEGTSGSNTSSATGSDIATFNLQGIAGGTYTANMQVSWGTLKYILQKRTDGATTTYAWLIDNPDNAKITVTNLSTTMTVSTDIKYTSDAMNGVGAKIYDAVSMAEFVNGENGVAGIVSSTGAVELSSASLGISGGAASADDLYMLPDSLESNVATDTLWGNLSTAKTIGTITLTFTPALAV